MAGRPENTSELTQRQSCGLPWGRGGGVGPPPHHRLHAGGARPVDTHAYLLMPTGGHHTSQGAMQAAQWCPWPITDRGARGRLEGVQVTVCSTGRHPGRGGLEQAHPPACPPRQQAGAPDRGPQNPGQGTQSSAGPLACRRARVCCLASPCCQSVSCHLDKFQAHGTVARKGHLQFRPQNVDTCCVFLSPPMCTHMHTHLP